MRRRSHCCLSQRVRRLLMVAALIACSPVIAWGANPPAAAASEADPYVAAAKDAGVPLQVLVAVAGAESAYHPWALDIEGRQVFCRSRAQAETVLANTATTNVDIGLMQINWRFWGPRLGIAKHDLLDPRINLLMGARILRDSLNRDGSVWRRISNYHSGGVRERDRYNQQVYDAYVRYLRGEVR
jgi:soluble lytic murein transglycosylase-like protein